MLVYSVTKLKRTPDCGSNFLQVYHTQVLLLHPKNDSCVDTKNITLRHSIQKTLLM